MKLKGLAKDIVDIVITIAIAAIIVIGVRKYIATPFIVDGHSMDYTLQDRERIFMWKLAKIDRFDIVVLEAPSNPSKLYIKRVIGLPGDTIEYKDNLLYLNGHPIEEAYLNEKITEYTAAGGGNFTEDFTLESVAGSDVVPEGKYFVMGDNRQNSLDGRSFGFINEETVIGQADVVIWPLNKIGLLDKYELNDQHELIKK